MKGVSPSDEEVRLFIDEAPKKIQKAAEYVAPDLSLPFLVLCLVLVYFHESQTYATIIVMISWFVLQVVSSMLKDEFRNDLFWSIFRLIFQVIAYILCGYAWSFAKLWLDLRNGHLTASKEFYACFMLDAFDSKCVTEQLLSYKAFIFQETLRLPISMAYTLSRDPAKMLMEEIYRHSAYSYYVVIHSALQQPEQVVHSNILFWWALYGAGYLFIGYIWSHIKLFVDVQQQALPKTIESDIGNAERVVQMLKWVVFQWVITWPISLLLTLIRHPLRIAADLVYRASVAQMTWIVEKAKQLRIK